MLQQTPPGGMPPIVDEPDRAGRRGRHSAGRPRYRRIVPLAITGAFVVIVAGVLITWAIVASSWYVGRAGNQVALYHGIQSAPLGISLSSVAERGGALSDLLPVDQEQVRSGIVADSHADGVCILARLKSDADRSVVTTTAPPSASVDASPSPSASGATASSPAPSPSPTPSPKSCPS